MRAPKARSLFRLGCLGERRKLPQRGLGRSPSRKTISCIYSCILSRNCDFIYQLSGASISPVLPVVVWLLQLLSGQKKLRRECLYVLISDRSRKSVCGFFVSPNIPCLAQGHSQDIDMGGVYRKILNQSLRELVSILGLGAKWSTITRCHFMATYSIWFWHLSWF
jgi:hypothetical protein